MRSWTTRSAALLAAALLIPACGSSDGPSVVNAVVAGTHYIVYFTGQTSGHTDLSGTGTVAMDGVALATLNTTENAGGPMTAPFNGVFPYTAFSDGSLHINPPGQTISGGVDSVPELSVLGSVTPMSPPLFMMTIRQNGTTLMTSDMSGDYYLLSFAVDPAGPSHRSETGTVNFDGAGGITVVSLTTNDEGAITNTTTGTATYAVTAGDGSLTLTINTVTYNGGLLDGGNIAILGSVTNGSDPAIIVLVKKGGTFTDADLDGAYWIATFGWKPGTMAHDAEVGTATFDGMGGLTAVLTDNEEGLIFTGSGGAATYSIAANGDLTLNTGDTFSGGVLQGGSIAVAAPTNIGSDPEIMVLIKK